MRRGKIKDEFKTSFSSPYYRQNFVNGEFEIKGGDRNLAHVKKDEMEAIIELYKIEVLPDKSENFDSLCNKLKG